MSVLQTASHRALLSALLLLSALTGAHADPCKNHYILDEIPPCPRILAPAGWAPTADMNAARYGHSATLLADGRVLVAGGSNGVALLSSAELYDPNTHTWRATGAMATPRSRHTATLLSDGKVLVVGAQRDVATSVLTTPAAEVYDPASGTWTAVGPMVTPRNSHTATLLNDGSVLIAGGEDIEHLWILDGVELYDPATQSFRPTRKLRDARVEHTATLLADGRVVVAGGSWMGDPQTTLRSVELYDPATETWQPAGRLPRGVMSHTAIALPDGRVLVAGGLNNVLENAWLLDPPSMTWTSVPNLSEPRAWPTAAMLPDGRVLLAGGWSWGSNALDTSETFDAATQTWARSGNLGAPRLWHTLTRLSDGRVLVAGGRIDRQGHAAVYLSSAEYYGGALAAEALDASLVE